MQSLLKFLRLQSTTFHACPFSLVKSLSECSIAKAAWHSGLSYATLLGWGAPSSFYEQLQGSQFSGYNETRFHEESSYSYSFCFDVFLIVWARQWHSCSFRLGLLRNTEIVLLTLLFWVIYLLFAKGIAAHPFQIPDKSELSAKPVYYGHLCA